MRKLRHYYEPGMAYFITSVTAGRKPLFLERLTCLFFLACLEYNKYVFSYKVYGFVVMPDHFHLAIQPSPDTTISQIMKHVKGNFARKYNYIRKGKNSIWQKSYYEKAIRGEAQLMNKIIYMHNNPIKDGLVEKPEDYEFSSYHYYCGNRYQNLVDDLYGGSDIPAAGQIAI